MRELGFNQALIDLFNDVRYNWRVNAVVLGGTSGSGGGYGAPPGGFVGQLPQSQVAGDTDELRIITSGSVSSLVDNLNRMRYWLTNQISGTEPIPTFPGQVWIDGSSGSAVKFRNETNTGWIGVSGGGSGSLDPNSPLDVGSGAIVGTSGSASHGDHVHRGVHSVLSPPGAFAYGDISLIAGTNVTISQSSGSFTFSSSGGVSSSRAINTTAPLVGGGDLSADRTLSIPQASHTVDGYLSAIDWTVFNSKVSNATPFDTGTPVDIGVSAITGTSGSMPHADHVHRGVHAMYTSPNSFAYGDITLVAGANTTISQSSGSFTISSSGGGGGGAVLDPTSPIDVGAAAVVGTSGSASHGDHVHRGVHGIYAEPGSLAYGDIDFIAGTGIVLSQSSGSFTWSVNTSQTGFHVHELMRWVADGGTTFDYPDFVSMIESVSDNGAVVDPTVYSLSSDNSQLIFDSATTAGHILTSNYTVEVA